MINMSAFGYLCVSSDRKRVKWRRLKNDSKCVA